MFRNQVSLRIPLRRFAAVDVLVFLGVLLLLFVVVRLGEGMAVPFNEAHQPPINLSLTALPYYAGRSLLRMFIALAASVAFTLVYGYAAAYNRYARVVLIPLLDILQSVPVLGFLSVTVVGFMSLFPGSLLGLELASIFAIFTAMAWNMTFSFYYSLMSVPKDLKEASAIYGLGPWQRFAQCEVPFSMIGLVWNGMMSFGGAWFFLAASEAITVLNKNIRLPGIGSYMATAIDQGNLPAIWAAIAAMIVMILLVDALFWRPVVAWSQKFKFEQTEATEAPRSRLLTVLQRSTALTTVQNRLVAPTFERFNLAVIRFSQQAVEGTPTGRAWRWAWRGLGLLVAAWLLFELARQAGTALPVLKAINVPLLKEAFLDGLFTMLRVVAVVAISTLIWTPIGVWIGMNPRIARIAQPLVQIAASFPATMAFPLVTVIFLYFHISLDWGGMLLMGLGTQWYILFNVIAGAMAIPTDLREATAVFGVRGWLRWLRLIIPGIFPFWVTGGVTAAGGAWNASIVAEIVSWKNQTLVAHGLGAFIAQATTVGNWSAIALGIAVMCVFVVSFNRLVWRPLYALAERKYRLDI